MFSKIWLTLVVLCVSPLIIFSQNKPILKLEMAPAVSIEFSPAVQILLPVLHFPISQHFDLGISYNSKRFTNYSYDGNGQHKYDISHNFASLYFTFNFFKEGKRLNPVIGYIISTTKGQIDYGNSTGTSVSPQHKQKLEEALDGSRISHGFQTGLDVRLSRAISIFTRFRAYSVMNFLDEDRTGPFPYDLNWDESKVLSIGHSYALLGVIININGGKKRQIR